MGVALLCTMSGDSGVRALKSCTKLNHPSYAMPSASPFYSPNFPGMDKSDITLDTSTSLIDLWGPAPVINSATFQRVSQDEIRSSCTSISQSETLLGCGASTTSSASSVDLHVGFVDNNNTSCSGNIQHQASLVASREGTYSDLEYQKFATWAQKHPESWSPREVLDWLYFTAEQHNLDGSKLRGEAFQDLPGADLCRMSREDFDQADPQFGGLYYEVFQSLLKSAEEFCVPTSSPMPESPVCPSFDVPSYNLSASPSGHVDSRLNAGYTSNTSCHSGHDIHPSHITHAYGGYPCPTPTSDSLRNPFIYPKHDRICTQPQTSSNGVYGKLGLDQFVDLSLPDDTLMSGSYYPSNGQYPLPGNHTPPFISSPPTFMPPGPPVRRPPGRPPKDKGLRDLHRPRDRRGTGKNQHLWEFIYDTLMNPMYNPQILRWENKQEGIFRFVQSEAVAQLWGNLKNNDNMTYEKLSRAMRHYYKRGILERVEGRRLVYKFSRTAMERRRQQQHSV